MATETKYPIPSFHFSVDWGGASFAFSEVSGLSIETQVIEYRDGANKDLSSIKMPGQQKFGNVTLKRGVMAKDNQFFEWWDKHLLNIIEKRQITISLLNENHVAVVAWTLLNAWPTKVSNSDLKATGNEISIESIELVHEGIKVVKPQ